MRIRKSIIKPVLGLIASLLLISCISPESAMQSYMGHQIKEVILQWGPANDIQPDGEGGKVYTWYFQRQGYTASRTFFCRSTGIIYGYRWKGL